MASSLPSVLLLGHSFIRRLRDDLRSHFDSRADDTFGLSNDAIVHLHGVSGLTVAKLRRDLRMVSSLSPTLFWNSVQMTLRTFPLRLLAPKLKSWYAYFLTPFQFGSSVYARSYLALERRFLTALHRYLTNISVASWNPFLMLFAGVIGVLTTLRCTRICRMGFM